MDKVLIADGDAQLLLILTETLKKYRKRFEVHAVGDGLAAIKALQKQHFSLVVFSIQMPKVNGMVLLSYLSENYSKIPRIIMTDHLTQDIKDYLERFSTFCFEKPFKVSELAATILSILNKQESLSGVISGVSVAAFIRLIEEEFITCLCEIELKNSHKGFLFFEGGALYNAWCNGRWGEEAAKQLLQSDDAKIKFRKPLKKKIPRQIKGKVSSLLAGAAKVRSSS